MTEYAPDQWKVILNGIHLKKDSWFRPADQDVRVNHLVVRGECYVTKPPMNGWNSFFMNSSVVISGLDERRNSGKALLSLERAHFDAAKESLSKLLQGSIGSGFTLEPIRSEKLEDHMDSDTEREMGHKHAFDEAMEYVKKAKEYNIRCLEASEKKDDTYFYLPISKFRLVDSR